MSAPSPAAEPLRRAARGGLRSWFSESSALDTRSLALLRIGLALCMLGDLALRWPLLRVFYSDAGVLPRELLSAQVPEYATPISLYLASGGESYPALLFGLTALAALALGLGWRTRAIVALCFWLELALQMRNPFALNGGNQQLRMALFWSMFLPLGARYSLDARRAREPAPMRVTGIEAFALLVQVAIIYFCAGIAKQSPQWIEMGNALHWVMIDPDWTRPFAAVAAHYPELLRVLTFATVGLEIAAPLLLFVSAWRGWLRALAVLALIGLQVGIGLTMKLGVFPYVSIATLGGLLPAVIWETWASRADAAEERPRPGSSRRWQKGFVGACLFWVVAYNADYWIDSIALPAWVTRPGRYVKLDQYWNMYHSVHRSQFYWDFQALSAGGDTISLAHPGFAPSWREEVERPLSNSYWNEYASNLQAPESAFLRAGLAAFWCSEWNLQAPAPARLAGIELLYVARYLRLDGDHEPWRTRSEGHFACER